MKIVARDKHLCRSAVVSRQVGTMGRSEYGWKERSDSPLIFAPSQLTGSATSTRMHA